MPLRRLDLVTLLLVAWSVGMSVGAQLLLRRGMSSLAELPALDLLRSAAASPWVLLGLGAYLLGTVSWLAVLSRIDLSVAYPLASLNFVLVTLFSATVLHEAIPAMRWAGTALVLAGILVVARGERARRPREEQA